MKLARTSLSALALLPVFVASTARAGMPEAAGTLLAEKGFTQNEIATLLGLAAMAIAVVLYLRWRKSK